VVDGDDSGIPTHWIGDEGEYLAAFNHPEHAVQACAMMVAIRDYLDWGPMTGSDQDLFQARFTAILAGLPDPGAIEIEEDE